MVLSEPELWPVLAQMSEAFMAHCESYSAPQSSCGSNYAKPFASDDGCGSVFVASQGCRGASSFHGSHSDCFSAPYTHLHDSHCGLQHSDVNLRMVAFEDATAIGAGVEGVIGCTVDQCGQPQPPHLCGHDGDIGSSVVDSALETLILGTSNNITLVVGDGNGDVLAATIGDGDRFFAGNGASDLLSIGTGDDNALIVGNGAGDTIFVGTGNNNDLHGGNGAGDVLQISTGDNNCLTVGDGTNANLVVGTGASNDLEAGNGSGDALSVGTGDNNILKAGNGSLDDLNIGDGNHNTICVGSGVGDRCEVGTGNHNLLTSGDGDGDLLFLGTGNHNALIAGNGAGDAAIVAVGDNNVVADGNGSGDLIDLELGSNNSLLDGNGSSDAVLVGGQIGKVGVGIDVGNNIVIGNGNGDQAWGSLGDANNYITGAGNDLVHTGGGSDFVYADNHTETATSSDPFHLASTDSLAQTLFADGGNDTFAIQGMVQTSCEPAGDGCGDSIEAACGSQEQCHPFGASEPGLGTTVMAGGGGVEKYWLSGLWGSAVITDFNAAHGDRLMIGGVSDPDIANLGSVHFQYVNSAYDSASGGSADLDLLITFGNPSNAAQSVTLIDYKPQDTGGAGGSEQYNGATFANPRAAEATLSHIFDFNLADNQAVSDHITALAAQNLILH